MLVGPHLNYCMQVLLVQFVKEVKKQFDHKQVGEFKHLEVQLKFEPVIWCWRQQVSIKYQLSKTIKSFYDF